MLGARSHTLVHCFVSADEFLHAQLVIASVRRKRHYLGLIATTAAKNSDWRRARLWADWETLGSLVRSSIERMFYRAQLI
jgi:hypothetical protein